MLSQQQQSATVNALHSFSEWAISQHVNHCTDIGPHREFTKSQLNPDPLS